RSHRSRRRAERRIGGRRDPVRPPRARNGPAHVGAAVVGVMSAPRATWAHLKPVIDRALERSNGRTADLVLVRADPSSAADVATVGDPPLTVIGSRSPLQIRAALREPRDQPLVVLTDLDHRALGDDLV